MRALEYQLDDLDKLILEALIHDSRRPFTEIAEKLGVSGGTIHVRVSKLKDAGIVKGSRLEVDYEKIGYSVMSFVGINLVNARDYNKVVEILRKSKRIVKAYYTTGDYNIFTEVWAKTVSDLHQFLLEVQKIPEVQTTQTIIVMDTPIDRMLQP